MQGSENRGQMAGVDAGTSPAVSQHQPQRGLVGMTSVARVMSLILVAVIPGGLLVLGAFAMARVVAEKMRLAEGGSRLRLARAVSQVRFRDLWNQARHVV